MYVCIYLFLAQNVSRFWAMAMSGCVAADTFVQKNQACRCARLLLSPREGEMPGGKDKWVNGWMDGWMDG